MGQAYQTMAAGVARIRLATLPSPLERARRLEEALHAEGADAPWIYLKRDDLLSLGLGGNKVRNLEFTIADAISERATDIVTSGRAQSNHCRLTAAACARTGMAAHLVFSGPRPTALTGNLLLDDLLGARMYFSDSDDRAVREQLARDVAGSIAGAGRRPCVIPVGGSDARGALGHALAAEELLDQLGDGERLSAVVLATATGGTQAGMLAGLAAAGSAARVHGFAVAASAAELVVVVERIAGELSRKFGTPPLNSGALVISDGVLGGGYGEKTEESDAAIKLLARTEGVFADPVYTGKGLAGLFRLIRAGAFRREEVVVFIHTGGVPALFAS